MWAYIGILNLIRQKQGKNNESLVGNKYREFCIEYTNIDHSSVLEIDNNDAQQDEYEDYEIVSIDENQSEYKIDEKDEIDKEEYDEDELDNHEDSFEDLDVSQAIQSLTTDDINGDDDKFEFLIDVPKQRSWCTEYFKILDLVPEKSVEAEASDHEKLVQTEKHKTSKSLLPQNQLPALSFVEFDFLAFK